MGERARFLAEPRNDRVKGARLGKAMHQRVPYVGPTPCSYFDGLSTSGPSPTPLDPSTRLRVSGHSTPGLGIAPTGEGARPLPGMDSGSGAGMTRGGGVRRGRR